MRIIYCWFIADQKAANPFTSSFKEWKKKELEGKCSVYNKHGGACEQISSEAYGVLHAYFWTMFAQNVKPQRSRRRPLCRLHGFRRALILPLFLWAFYVHGWFPWSCILCVIMCAGGGGQFTLLTLDWGPRLLFIAPSFGLSLPILRLCSFYLLVYR